MVLIFSELFMNTSQDAIEISRADNTAFIVSDIVVPGTRFQL